MLEGITVLSTEVCNDSWNLSDGLILFLIIGLIGGFLGFCLYKMITEIGSFEEQTEMNIAGILTVIVIALAIIIPSNLVKDFQYEDYNKYQVTISDDVTFNDLNDKYIVWHQDDKIFTIIERDSRHIKKDE
jgi:H+/Cl- antiporter ClcA